jgi:hypothetical protein
MPAIDRKITAGAMPAFSRKTPKKTPEMHHAS